MRRRASEVGPFDHVLALQEQAEDERLAEEEAERKRIAAIRMMLCTRAITITGSTPERPGLQRGLEHGLFMGRIEEGNLLPETDPAVQLYPDAFEPVECGSRLRTVTWRRLSNDPRRRSSAIRRPSHSPAKACRRSVASELERHGQGHPRAALEIEERSHG